MTLLSTQHQYMCSPAVPLFVQRISPSQRVGEKLPPRARVEIDQGEEGMDSINKADIEPGPHQLYLEPRNSKESTNVPLLVQHISPSHGVEKKLTPRGEIGQGKDDIDSNNKAGNEPGPHQLDVKPRNSKENTNVPLLVQHISPSQGVGEKLTPMARWEIGQGEDGMESNDNADNKLGPGQVELKQINTKKDTPTVNMEDKLIVLFSKFIKDILPQEQLSVKQKLLNSLALEHDKSNLDPKSTKQHEMKKKRNNENEIILQTKDIFAGIGRMVTELIKEVNKANELKLKEHPDKYSKVGELTH